MSKLATKYFSRIVEISKKPRVAVGREFPFPFPFPQGKPYSQSHGNPAVSDYRVLPGYTNVRLSCRFHCIMFRFVFYEKTTDSIVR